MKKIKEPQRKIEDLEFEVIGHIVLPLRIGGNKVSDFRLSLFKFAAQNYHVLEKGDIKGKTDTIVRVESACPFAHLYGSRLCDCEWQLR